MLSRALIVLLLVLNVGVAAWWALRPAPQAPVVTQPQGVARLQLLSEAPPRPQLLVPAIAPDAAEETSATPTPTQTATAAPTDADKAPGPAATADAVATTCYSFGPFASAGQAATVRTRLQPRVQRIAVRSRTATPARGWRVYLPPQASAEAANAMATRIAVAGFSDYLILREGADANAIALGRYGNEATARRRVAALTAAGFTARAEPLGGGESSIWLDIAAAPGFDAAAAQALVAAPGRQPLDCARLQ